MAQSGYLHFRRGSTVAQLGEHGIDAFVANQVVFENKHFNDPEEDVYFCGPYASYKGIEDQVFDTCLFSKRDHHNEMPGEKPGVDDLEISTIGLRAKGKVTKALDYNFESAYQFGEKGPDDHEAWAAHASAGYTFGFPWSPRKTLVMECGWC